MTTSKTLGIWRAMASAPTKQNDIYDKQLAHIKQIDGLTVPTSSSEATARLAVFVVISILDDVGARQKEEAVKKLKRSGTRLKRAETVTDAAMREEREKKDKAYEFEAADVAELELVEATCIPALQSGLAILSARSRSSRSPPRLLPCACPSCASSSSRPATLMMAEACCFSLQGAGLGSLVSVLLSFAEVAGISWMRVDTLARSYTGETALYEASAAGHLEVAKMLLQRTSLQISGGAAENTNGWTPKTASTDEFVTKLRKLQSEAPFICIARGDGVVKTSTAQALLSATAMGKGETERDGLKNRTTCIDGAMKRTDIDAVRHKVASNGGPFVLLLTRSLLADPLAMIAMIAAFDLARPIVGVYCDGLDGGNFVYEAFDDLDDFLNRNHPDTLKTLQEHGIDVERDGHKCLVILRHAAEDWTKECYHPYQRAGQRRRSRVFPSLARRPRVGHSRTSREAQRGAARARCRQGPQGRREVGEGPTTQD